MAEHITYDWYYDSREKKISSIIKNYDEIIGEFSLILGKGFPNQLYIDVDEQYQGRRYSSILLKNFHEYIYYNWNNSRGMYILTDNNRASRPYIELDQDMLIYIDSDVSGNSRGPSFWRKIGMTPSRYSTKSSHSRRTVDSYGYELSITLRKLLQKIKNA
jgi:GNAT superfamily N-acetyltransferase